MTNPEAMVPMSDFSNVSGTHLDLISQYGALNASGSLFVSPTPDVTLEKWSNVQKFQKVTDSEAVIGMSDFSNVSGPILSLLPQYCVLIASGTVPVSPTPDVRLEK